MPEYNLKARIWKLQELEARGVIKPQHQAELDSYRQQGLVPGSPKPKPASATTNADMKALEAANSKAAAERDAMPTYLAAAQAIDDLGDKGPWTSALMDAGAPGQGEAAPDRGWLGNVLGPIASLPMNVGGFLYRGVTPRKVLAARDNMRTIAAQGALSRTAQLKGAASDRDMAMVRLAGIDTAKYPEENRRVIHDVRIPTIARRHSNLMPRSIPI